MSVTQEHAPGLPAPGGHPLLCRGGLRLFRIRITSRDLRLWEHVHLPLTSCATA